MIDQELDEEVDKFVEDVLDIINCFFDIQDNLQCSVEDWEIVEIFEDEVKIYGELVSIMFFSVFGYFKDWFVVFLVKWCQWLKILNQM